MLLTVCRNIVAGPLRQSVLIILRQYTYISVRSGGKLLEIGCGSKPSLCFSSHLFVGRLHGAKFFPLRLQL